MEGSARKSRARSRLGRLYHGQPVSQKMRSQVANAARFSKAGLLGELRRVHALVGKEWLTSGDFNVHSITSDAAVRNHFGTFLKGLDAAGIRPRPAQTALRTFRPYAKTVLGKGRAVIPSFGDQDIDAQN
jgi:hypothetical protein